MSEEKRGSRNTPNKGFQRKNVRPRKPRMPKNQYRNDDDFNWGKVLKVVLSWSAIIFGVFILVTLFRSQEISQVEVSYTEYREFLRDGKISAATIKKPRRNRAPAGSRSPTSIFS
jgi:hypothetical protein